MYSNNFFLFLVFIFTLLRSHPTEAQQANFKNYSVNDGLAQSQVYTITESNQGYLWVGTRGGGLCRFDGVEFETFTKKDGLPSNYINHLYVDRSERLWIATRNGLCSWKENKITTHSLNRDSSISIINVVLEDKNGRLWVGSEQGLFYFKDSTFEQQTLSNGSLNIEVTSLTEGKDSDLWVGTNRGLYHLNSEGIKSYKARDGLNSSYVISLAYDDHNNLWVGTYGKGISIITQQEIVDLKALTPLNSSIIHDLTKDSKGDIWISTLVKGLIKWNHSDSTLTYFNESDGLANNHVRCVYEDSWKNLWIGTSGGGISKFFGQHFDLYNTSSIQLKSNYIYAVEAVNDTDIWISTSGLGVNRYVNGKTIYYGSDSGFVDAKVKTICRSDSGVVWLGTDGKGLFLFNGKTFQQFDFKTKVGSAWIKDIKIDRNQDVWVATSGGGITKISIDQTIDTIQFSYQRFNRSKGLSSNRVSTLHIDKKNRIWFAYQSGGLGYVQHDSIVSHVAIKNSIAYTPIRSIVEDTLENLWLGTAGKGVYRLKLYADTLSLSNFSSEQVLSSDNIYLLEVDLQSNLWVGSEKGVDKMKLDQEGNVLEVTSFGYEEGFKGVETSKNAITIDNQGGVWIGTINGLFRYNANYKSENKLPPVLNFNDVSLFYSSIMDSTYAAYRNALRSNPKALMLLDHDQNHITFDFKGLLLTKPNQVKYKWKLVGLESEWSPATKKRSITYSNLSAGTYRFEVLSCNEDGIWNEQPEVIAFKILTPFWKTSWFFWAAIIGIVIILSIVIWLRIRAINKKARIAQELLKMENEVLILEQKALRLQMNPHFIFNCLNSIQSMIVKKDDKTARYFLSKFSKLMRKTLDNSREQLIILDDEIETLENYLSIEKFCNEDHFDYSIEVADEIASDFIQIPPMLIQPFVENAIVHGVAHKTSGGKIKLRFSITEHTLICMIEDNGVGRTKAEAFTKNRSDGHKSTALIVTQERLAYLKGDSSKQELTIEDLFDKNQEGCGTRVVLKIALEE